MPSKGQLEFIYSEKATKFWEISSLPLLSYVESVKSKVEISQNFVAFSEYMNFNLERKLQCLQVTPKNELENENYW